MNPREVAEIKEAEQLLQAAERQFPSEKSAEMFKEAFDVLNDYVECEDVSDIIKEFIHNIKLSYTRSTMAKLNQIQDFDIFLYYLIVLNVQMKPEFEKLRKNNPDLGAQYDACRERFKLQLDELVHELKNT